MADEFNYSAQMMKVNDELGIVFGFGIVCKVDGQPYVDAHNDHIPEDGMLNAVTDFMKNSRVAKEMHQGAPIGEVLFSFPLTSDIAKSLNIETVRTGWLVGFKPDGDEVLSKFRDGTYTGFSIGGRYIVNEESD